ncbi:hypothetical protein ACN27F_01710 [Solwaraspora sp. WMMB335]|uniref:hypothetical protein n=1 Tax=Solwaraspora sp. WMMB335 TaxID=3404118 RepID=UPI003B94A284
MTDQHTALDAALEQVFQAARAHLATVKAAQGRIDDDDVWQAYVALNNASYAYDELLLDAFGEVTPWDVESIDPQEADERFGVGLGGADGTAPDDSYPQVVSVRQRRDYRVPSVAALTRIAEAARRQGSPSGVAEPVDSVGEAVLELLQAGDGSLGALDIPELEPLDGVVMVHEVTTALDPEAFDETDVDGPFQSVPGDQIVGRLDEHAYLPEESDSAATDTTTTSTTTTTTGVVGAGHPDRPDIR